jgi:hypothetical protein
MTSPELPKIAIAEQLAKNIAARCREDAGDLLRKCEENRSCGVN